MRLILAFAVVLLAASLTGQVEHAPTVAECQADQRLWLADLEGQREHLPGFAVLGEWNHEMDNCQKVDTDNRWKYYNTSGEVDAEKLVRLINFLNRHDLYQKFKEEDAAGKR